MSLLLILIVALSAGLRGRSDWGVMGLTRLLARPELMQTLPVQRGVPLGGKMERLWESLPAQANAVLSLAGHKLKGSSCMHAGLPTVCDIKHVELIDCLFCFLGDY